MLAHTRWASVGIISEANAHPLNQEELGRLRAPTTSRPRSTATSTTTPTSRRSRRCISRPRSRPTRRSSRRSCPRRIDERRRARSRRSARRSPSFEGSVAIARRPRPDPGRVLLAQRGQRPGAVRRSRRRRVRGRERAVRRRRGMRPLPPPRRRDDARCPGKPGNAGPDRRVDAARGPSTGSSGWSLRRLARCPCPRPSCKQPEITTRDVDRGDAPHYLLKEIYEAPASFRKTLRGRIVERRRAPRGAPPARDAPAPTSSSGCGRATLRRVHRHRSGHRGDRRARASRSRSRRTLRRAFAHRSRR